MMPAQRREELSIRASSVTVKFKINSEGVISSVIKSTAGCRRRPKLLRDRHHEAVALRQMDRRHDQDAEHEQEMTLRFNFRGGPVTLTSAAPTDRSRSAARAEPLNVALIISRKINDRRRSRGDRDAN